MTGPLQRSTLSPARGTIARSPQAARAPQGLGRDSSSPWEVGWEWLTGTGPQSHHFKDGDPFTKLLQQHDHIQTVRDDAISRLAKGQRNISNISMPYRLGGIEGVPKYLRDYSTLATAGQTGNLAVTYLGSYNLTYSVSSVDEKAGTATIAFSVKNSSTIASATHPPVVGYTKWWDQNVGNPLNQFFSTGPMSSKMQYFDWSEQIRFRNTR